MCYSNRISMNLKSCSKVTTKDLNTSTLYKYLNKEDVSSTQWKKVNYFTWRRRMISLIIVLFLKALQFKKGLVIILTYFNIVCTYILNEMNF
jgi:sortase (surface protein transpeptidase)